VRALFAFLLLAAAAIAVALFARYNTGYALLVAPPYRLEISLNAFVVLVFAAFFLLYLLLRFAARLAALPAEVRESRRRQQAERARNRQDAALVALLEGRFGKAREFAEEALAIPGSGGVPALIAARAATEMHEFDVAKTLLERADVRVDSLAVPRLMLEAEIALAQSRGGDALAILAELKREAGSHTAALRLEMRTLAAAGRHAEVPPLVDQLVKRKVYDTAQGEMLRASAHAEALAELAADPGGLRDYWNRLPEAERLHPKVAREAARSFVALGGDREAADLIARALERGWESELAELYAECRTPNPTRQLETAERWLLTHNQDPALLRALGRLCERTELWGKAQTYFEASIALEDGWMSRVALGEMLARLGRHDDANVHLAAALRLALAALGHRPADRHR
jgi:HemY protein